jgi:sulfur carrier protein ThiS
MGRVTLELPRILRDCTDGRSPLEIEADCLETAFAAIRNRWPVLATHVFTEAGELRPHVLVLHNDRLVPRAPRPELPLAAGDRLTIVQAVSGG